MTGEPFARASNTVGLACDGTRENQANLPLLTNFGPRIDTVDFGRGSVAPAGSDISSAHLPFAAMSSGG